MWKHPITANQVQALKSFGYEEIPCIQKVLACGDNGNPIALWDILIFITNTIPRQSIIFNTSKQTQYTQAHFSLSFILNGHSLKKWMLKKHAEYNVLFFPGLGAMAETNVIVKNVEAQLEKLALSHHPYYYPLY